MDTFPYHIQSNLTHYSHIITFNLVNLGIFILKIGHRPFDIQERELQHDSEELKTNSS